MLNLGRGLIVAALLIASSMSAFAQDKSETFLVTGMGSTHELAVQNAASNALTAAVGKFVDVETQIEKRTEIKDGVALITKDLTENFISSSNGTIEGMEVLSSEASGSLFTVEAVVDVRMDDLRTAMAGRVELSKPMDRNIFASIKANKNNATQKVEAVASGLFLPSQDVSLINISLGDPFDLERLLDDPSLLGGAYNRDVIFPSIRRVFASPENNNPEWAINSLKEMLATVDFSYVVVPVEISHNSETFEQWETLAKTLASSSNEFIIDEGTAIRSDNLGLKRNEELNQFLRTQTASSIKVCFVKLGASVRCYEINDIPPALGADQFPVLSQIAQDGFSKMARSDLVYDVKMSLISMEGALISSVEVGDAEIAWYFRTPDEFYAYNYQTPVPKPGLLEADPSLITSFGAGRVFAIFDRKRVNVLFPLTLEQLEATGDIKVELIPPQTTYR